MQRFFVRFPLGPSLVVEDERLYHQISRVLRMRPGDQAAFFSGERIDHVYEVVSVEKKRVSFTRVREIVKPSSDAPEVSVFQALPNKLEKLEFILQKGVESGIGSFTFFPSERSQPLPGLDRKKERLMEIAREALEQCGGDTMPAIRFEKALPKPAKNPRIVTDTLENHVPIREVAESSGYEVCIGPEGGWSDAERAAFRSEGAVFVSLGDRVFRTETAPIVAAFFLRNR